MISVHVRKLLRIQRIHLFPSRGPMMLGAQRASAKANAGHRNGHKDRMSSRLIVFPLLPVTDISSICPRILLPLLSRVKQTASRHRPENFPARRHI
jgi:hypothetical protein